MDIYIYITFMYMIDKVEKNSNGGEYILAHNDPQVSPWATFVCDDLLFVQHYFIFCV